jgi:hypothetical protein
VQDCPSGTFRSGGVGRIGFFRQTSRYEVIPGRCLLAAVDGAQWSALFLVSVAVGVLAGGVI